MRYNFTVNVEVERAEGKFATRDEIGELIRQSLDEADPGEMQGENGGNYVVTTWDVTET
jgi:hypothetical protein